ncbi:PEBP-like protein [Mycena galericulata]|nr:PEBP-like protein [Mycena galericulata]
MQLALLLSLFVFVAGQDVSFRAVERAFSDAKIPATLGIPLNPKALLEVSFPQVHGPPITLHAGIYVLVNGAHTAVGPLSMVDPDAPTPQAPIYAQLRHFLGGDFYLGGDGCQLVNSTPAISESVQPTPPTGSDAHRQSEAFARQQLVNASTSILSFNISQFASAVGLGNPVAGIFMLVAPDSKSA